MRISDWSSDVCSSDLSADEAQQHLPKNASRCAILGEPQSALGQYGASKPNNPPAAVDYLEYHRAYKTPYEIAMMREATRRGVRAHRAAERAFRSEEHTSELQSLMRISYAVVCWQKQQESTE